VVRSASESSTGRGSPRLTREALARLAPEQVFLGRNMSKADVFKYRVSEGPVAVKDYGSRPFFARHTVGRLFVRRECRAYERAGSVPGIAPFLGRLGPFALATRWIDSPTLAELPRGTTPSEIFDRLDAIIAALHACGVAISDLHHRDVLVAADGAVHVVDFAASYVLSGNPTWVGRRVFARLSAQDRLAAARMRARFTGRPEDEALAGVDPASVRLWNAGRGLKALWDRLRRKQA
jgi:hypothetical protein